MPNHRPPRSEAMVAAVVLLEEAGWSWEEAEVLLDRITPYHLAYAMTRTRPSSSSSAPARSINLEDF